MREAHGNHSLLKSLMIVLANEPIKLTSGKSPIAWKEQVAAIYILVGESQSILACTKYNKVYGSRNKGGYPQQEVQMRFVPAIDNHRYSVTPSMKMKTIKMMRRQKRTPQNLTRITMHCPSTTTSSMEATKQHRLSQLPSGSLPTPTEHYHQLSNPEHAKRHVWRIRMRPSLQVHPKRKGKQLCQ